MSKSFIFVLFYSVLSFNSQNVLAQIFDNSYSYGPDSLKFEPKLMEETTSGDWICIGNDKLFKISNNGTIIWARDIICPIIKDLELDSDGNIYYLYHEPDINGYVHTSLVKLDPSGNYIWKNTLGSGYSEFEGNDLFIGNLTYIYMVGRMKSDSIWHNVITKFLYTGPEAWSRRIYLQSVNYEALIKIDQAPGGKLYLLGQFDNMTTVFEFSEEGALSGMKRYWTSDSLKPVDIIARSDSDIQILMNKYSFSDHFYDQTFVKMGVDEDLTIVMAKEYSILNNELRAVDLESYGGLYFIMANKLGAGESTIIEKTDLAGNHIQIRDIWDQQEDQRGLDLNVRPDQSIVVLYEFNPDSIHLISSTNQQMQSNCNYDFSSIYVDDITISQSMAVPLIFSSAFPVISIAIPYSLEINDLYQTTHCYGFASANENVQFEVSIYPNPVVDILEISCEQKIKTIFLFDIQGKEIEYDYYNNQLSLGHLNPGIFVLVLEFQNGSRIEKKILKL